MDSAAEEKELLAFGYRKLEHAGFSWLATREGTRFLQEVEDWSEHALALRKGWTSTRRRYHVRYFATNGEKNSYFIKTYFPKENGRWFFIRKDNRARREFGNTLAAYKKGIQTVLPVAVGQRGRGSGWSIIIYPFLDHATSLPALYAGRGSGALGVRERRSLEKMVGRMTRRMVDSGLYPRDFVLDHFLVQKAEGRPFQIYWVDVERVKFSSLFTRRKSVRILARLLAQMERFRNLGYRVNRSSMMRIAHAFFHKEASEKLDKKICRDVIRSARKLWFHKGWDKKRPEEAVPIKR